MKSLTQIAISLILAPLACLYAQIAVGQVKIQQSSFDESAAVQPTSEIRLKLDRLPTPEEGNLAIFIGRTDITSQFRLVGTEFIYQPTIFPLPSGETKVIVYVVKGNDWKEIAQLPLKVANQQQAENSNPSTIQSIQEQASSETPEAKSPSLKQKPAEKQPDDLPKPSETLNPSKPELEKPGTEVTSQPQPEQPTQAQPQKSTQPEIQSKPSTSAADLSNSFQPQRSQSRATQLEPLQAKPAAPSDFTSTFKPRFNINVKSQFLEQSIGDAQPSERPTFTDATAETGFESEITSGTFTLQTKFSMLGATFQPEALRFGELGERAPNFDLTEYQLDAKWGPVQFTMGHLCYGNHPFLLSNVCSRGMTLKVNFTDRIDLSVNSMSANSIVGFDNMSGLDQLSQNNITAATLGFQLIKNDFGGIRLEATVMDGKRPAVSNFNEGQVVDAEKSRGFGVRLFGTDNSGRLRIDVGYARSTFTNPPDRQLVDASTGAELPQIR